MRRLLYGILLLSTFGCGSATTGIDGGEPDSGPSARPDAGTRHDAGSPGHDAGVVDAGEVDAGEVDAGVPDAGIPDAGSTNAVGGLVGLYQAKGTAESVKVTLMVPVVAFVGPFHHAYDDQDGGFGCTGDHYDSSAAGPPDSNAGTITISGYSGGSFYSLSGGSSSSTMTCMIQGTSYACDYSDGSLATTDPFGPSANPLGSGPITFTGSGGSAFGAFSLSASPAGTLTVSQDLSSISYSATSDTTLTYSCAGSCSSSLVLVSLLASQNSPSNPTGTSSTTGSVSCVAQGTGSITIPAGAIAAMFDNDSTFQSVTTTVIRSTATLPSTKDSNGQTVVANVGEGVFGIAPK